MIGLAKIGARHRLKKMTESCHLPIKSYIVYSVRLIQSEWRDVK